MNIRLFTFFQSLKLWKFGVVFKIFECQDQYTLVEMDGVVERCLQGGLSGEESPFLLVQAGLTLLLLLEIELPFRYLLN